MKGMEILKLIGYDNDCITSTEIWIATEVYKLARKQDNEIKELDKTCVIGKSELLKCVKCGNTYIPHLIKPLTICDSCADSF